MKSKIFILIFLLLTSSYLSQTLVKETINTKIYTLTIQNNDNYEIITENGINLIKFTNLPDESKPGKFNLPNKDLLIAIPENTKPSVQLEILNKLEINAVPIINPIVVKTSDSTIVYEEAEPTYEEESIYEVKGFLYIDKQYCIHISYKPIYFDLNKRKIVKIEEMNFILTFKTTLPDLNVTSNNKNGLVLNNGFFGDMNSKAKLQIEENWIDYNKTYLKLGVIKDDVYRITQQDLNENGVNVNEINPETFKLFVKGKEIPIYVSGSSDGIFHENDYIEFLGVRNYGAKDYRTPAIYGQPYKEYLNLYSDTTAYWLTWDGEIGQRIDTLSIFSGVAQDTIDYYDQFFHFEQNPWCDYSLEGGTLRREDPEIYENETWLWWGQYVGSATQNFSVANLYPNKTAKAYVKLQSWGTNVTQNAHLLGLRINNYSTMYDSGYINKYQVKTLTAEFNSNLLNNGTNSIKIVSQATQATINSCFGDWREIEYPRYLLAQNDTLNFRYTDRDSLIKLSTFKIGNVNSNDNILYKYLGGYKFKQIKNYTRINNELYFIDSLKQNDWYVLKTPATVKKPIFYYKKQFVNLKSTANQADYLLITHPKFLNKANEYATFVQSSYNINAKVINVFDIYDEFNYGMFAPQPIKEFLQYAYHNWQTPNIKNVCIVGRSNYDYYGYKTKYQAAPVEICYVPSYGSPVSDTWYVVWDTTGANIPQINIGRLPVRSNEEFEHYFEKHQNYVNNPYTKWNKTFLFFSGGNFTDPNQINTLKGINDNLIDQYVNPSPIGGLATHFYKTVNPVSNFGPYSAAYIQQQIDYGSVFISYLGHSGTQTWDNSITDPIQLKNLYNKSALITDFGCSTARFAEPDITSFSELFVNGLSGQAIGYIGNSSLGFTSTSYIAPKLFFEKVLRDSIYNLGDAHRLAKTSMLTNYGSTGTYKLFALTNTLVGDPIINLAIPQKVNLSISESDIKLSRQIDDLEDSTLCNVFYNNYGRTIQDSTSILIKHYYNNLLLEQYSYQKEIPLLNDSISCYLKVRNMPGEHKLEVVLDENSFIDEIYETDNNVLFSFSVASTSIRTLLFSKYENQVKKDFFLINPISKPNSNSISVKIADNANFIGADSLSISLNKLFTNINLLSYSNFDRIWLKTKLQNLTEYNEPVSIVLGNKDNYLLRDSITFNLGLLEKIKYSDNSVKLDSIQYHLYALSAGYNAGRTAIIAINNQNFIPENTMRGFHVGRFNSSTLEFIEYKLFNVAAGATANALFVTYLDSISTNEIVFFAVSDDGGEGLTSAVRNKIMEFGSQYISSFGYRKSWAMIGYKGAPTGSVPEGLKSAFDGKVEIDTVITRMPSSGYYVTSTIGPVNNWKNLEVGQVLPEGSSIQYKAIGITDSGRVDTLNSIVVNEQGIGDLSNINAKTYPFIKIKSDFAINPGAESPSLNLLAVDYDKLPELAQNYQTVTVSSDSIDQGEVIKIDYAFMNLGGSKADSFNVMVNLVKSDNSKRIVVDTLIASADTMAIKEFQYSYKTNFEDGYGNMAFEVYLDPENKIKELYKDNNYYKIPFYVIKDTVTNLHSATVSTTFDEIDIAEGDFVSSNPNIKINLDYMSLFPYSDTTAIRFYLDGVRKYRTQLDSTVYDTISKRVIYCLKPDLEDGEHTIRIQGENLEGDLGSTNGYQKSFVVSSEAKILYAYNYPNPFSEDTYFTFKLTQVPDELNIRIYTVAGRLIKKINVSPALLNVDFNKIYWDGKDEDGDDVANGVYFYKIILKNGDKQENITQKLAKVK